MATKKHGKETKDTNGNRVISYKLRADLKKEYKRLGGSGSWEPEHINVPRVN